MEPWLHGSASRLSNTGGLKYIGSQLIDLLFAWLTKLGKFLIGKGTSPSERHLF